MIIWYYTRKFIPKHDMQLLFDNIVLMIIIIVFFSIYLTVFRDILGFKYIMAKDYIYD